MKNLYAVLLVFLFAQPVQSFEWHSPQDAKQLIGRQAMICGFVGSTRYARDRQGAPTFINLGPAFPQHIFTIVIWGSDRGNFRYSPENLSGRVCVYGQVTTYQGLPRIEVSSPEQITSGE